VSRHRSTRPRVALGVVVLVGLLFVFVFPTRTWLEQQRQTRDVEEQIGLLQAENEKLEEEQERLRSDEAVERLARERFNLVNPGEQAYVIVPAPTTTTTPIPPDGDGEGAPSEDPTG